MSATEKQDRIGDVVVVGGGPAGLTAGAELVRAGLSPRVLEAASLVGGISRTEQYRGFHFDMGGHRFYTKSPEVEQFWNEMLGDDFLDRARLSRIYYNRTFFPYPLKAWETVRGLGVIECIRITGSVVWWKIFPHRQENTFEEWVTNRFGQRLFRTFFKTYTEKVWGISCQELKAEWAAQRIKGLSMKTAVMSMLFKPRNVVKTLIDRFRYPRRGPGMMWTTVADRITAGGGSVELNSEVVGLRSDGTSKIEQVVVRQNGEEKTISADQFICSMPLTEVVKRMDPPAPEHVQASASQLKYRDFLTVCLIVRRKDLFADNWIYIHDPSVKVGRIQNYGNWSPEMVPDAECSSLGLEYFCNEGDDLWTMSDEALIALGKREVASLGLADAADIEDGCVFKVPKSYPVYDSAYREHLEVVRTWVEQFTNLQMVGRNGLHRYNNQDHAMLTGMYAVRNLTEDASHDLWSVNADQEYLEEVQEDSQKQPATVVKPRVRGVKQTTGAET